MDEWKEIEGYEGLYEVSNTGKIYSHLSGRKIKGTYRKGYRRVSLYKDGTTEIISTHRLVYQAFGKEELKSEYNIHHLNGVKDDNHIDNLQQISHAKHTTLHNNTPEHLEQVKCLHESNKKPIYTTYRNERLDFDSVKSAGKWVLKNLPNNAKGYKSITSSIGSTLSGRQKSAYGLVWNYIK